MKLKRLAAGLLTGMCIVSMFTGCSGADKKTDTDNNKNSKTETSYMTPSHSDDILAFTLVPDYDSAIIVKIQDNGIVAKASFKNADSVNGQYKYTGNIYNDKVDIVEYKRAKGSGNNAVPRIRFEYVCDAPRFELRCENEYETKTRKAFLKDAKSTGFSQPINDQDTYEENAFYIESLTEIIYNKYINDYPEEVTGVDIYKSVRKSSDGKKAVIITNTGDYFKLSNLNGDFSLFGL